MKQLLLFQLLVLLTKVSLTQDGFLELLDQVDVQEEPIMKF